MIESTSAVDDLETRSRYHHESHRTLISTVRAGAGVARDVDAIIVPTARPAPAMRHAIGLASRLGCTLVALCSKSSSAREVVALADGVASVVAIDVRGPLRELVPRFETCFLMENTRFERRTDTSLKRNLGLLLSHLMGWRRVVFLDDDITVLRAQDLRVAAGLTDTHAAVGLNVVGYPDNSVVCHAYREAGGPQKTFIGGGALAVGARSMTSFFPNIYNEDWFFLLDDEGLRRSAVAGEVRQAPYDPFATRQRAAKEELGDLLAEGLFALLDDGRTTRDATHRFWRGFLVTRFRFINDVLAMVDSTVRDGDRRRRMLTALRAARAQCESIRADQCVRYLAAWRSDRVRWRQHLDELRARKGPEVRGLEKLLSYLGIAHEAWHSRPTGQGLHENAADLGLAPAASVGQ
ncbi:hypothetical protein [Actinophytocola xanthii]|uniref:Glycosyltransferase 2-like domain-containing protein n=1 Tax=Actinophytocola xanthii TaxID=1912961 RepID=A0A1Q8CPL7_9PSEU|nr:hypothetical protein [Actinophytocola xanthii]OLF16286.1 hypothetical protein BU204_16980 [Actinophytocola xanthii]